MKTTKYVTYITVAALLLSACSGHQANSIKGFLGWGVSDNGSDSTSEAQDLANYTSIDVQADESIQKMNNYVLNGLSKDGKPDPTRQARNIRVSGIVVEMDATKSPFKDYICATGDQKNEACIYNIHSLIVEGNKIKIKGLLNFRQTNLQLVADEITFEDDGVIDVTPLEFQDVPDPINPNSGATHGTDGATGENSGSVKLFSPKVTVKGDLNTPRIIANGGAGQNGGPGHNGVDGISLPPLTVLGKQSKDGIEYEVVYRTYLRRYEERSCWGAGWRIPCGSSEAVFQEMSGNQWPGHGGNAIPGGFPGAGGSGGLIELNSNTLNDQAPTPEGVAPFTQAKAGPHGASAGTYKGGAPGTPIYSAKLIAVNNDTPSAAYNTEFNISLPGQDATSPDQPQSSKPNGQVTINTATILPYSAAFFKNRLRMIREHYLAREFSTVGIALKKDIQNISHRIDAQTTTEFNAILAKYSVLYSQLRLSQDYFGHSLNEAPLYALDFNINQFEAEVNMQLQSYFLTEKILGLLSEKEKKQEALGELVKHYGNVIAYESTQTNIKSAKVNDLQVQSVSFNNQEDAYTRLLIDLDRQIEARAKSDLEFRHRSDELRKNIKVLASLAKVIPAGQPMLAAGGALLDVIVSPPESGSAEEWIAYISKTKSEIEKLTNPEEIAKSRKNLNDFIDSLRVSNLDGKTNEEKINYLKTLYDDLGPVFTKMKAIAEGFNQSVVSSEELQAEINRIKASDPLFLDATNRLQELLKEKLKLNSMLQDLTVDILKSASVIDTALSLSIVSSNEFLQGVEYGNTLLKDLMIEIQHKAEERLLYVYSEVLKGYEYTTLEKVPFKNNFQLIHEATMDLIKKNMTPEQAQPVLNALYMTFINNILSSLDTKFHQTDPIIILKKDVVTLSLNQDQVSHLNKNGITTASLTPSIYGTRQKNIRIKSIDIESADFFTDGLSLPSDKTQKAFIKITHGGQGVIENLDGKIHSYTYLNAQSIHSWGSSYQFIDGIVQKNVIYRDESIKGLLGLLIKDKTNTLLYSPIFSQPAGLAELVIERNDIGPVTPALTNLQLKITYTFTE